MVILAVDNNDQDLKTLVEMVKKEIPTSKVVAMPDYPEAVEYVQKANPGFAFVNIDGHIGECNRLIYEVLTKSSETVIIATSNYENYAVDAFRLHVSGFITKPLDAQTIKKEIEYHLKHKTIKDVKPLIKIMALGNFECFIEGEPVKFKYQKTKELLAYLIDRKGAMVTNKELTEILWGDGKQKEAYIKNIKIDLERRFCEAGFDDAIIRERGIIGINTKKVDCDYYDLINGACRMQGNYWGEYMNQYKWGDTTRKYLEKHFKLETRDIK